MLAGERDPEVLADLARRQMRRKIPRLQQALTGRFSDAHALVLGEVLAHLDYLDGAIARVSGRVEEVISPFARKRELLCTIPGVDRRLAEAIIGEIGVDMSQFHTYARLASWTGMCPGQHESAGSHVGARLGTATPVATPSCGGRDGRPPGPATPTSPPSTNV